MENFLSKSSPPLRGKLRVPGDKSISHRAIMLGAIADGVTFIEGFLTGADCLATIQAFHHMGVDMEGPNDSQVIVHGVGVHGLQPPSDCLDVGNSGTSMRLLTGLLAGQAFATELTGDQSLLRRPMARVVEPLRQMGADIEMQSGGLPPLCIKKAAKLTGIRYQMPIASAQVKSCLLLAGLYAEGETSVIEPTLTRDHSERMLQAFSYPILATGRKISLFGGGQLKATQVRIPSDISSAAFFLVAASIIPGSDILLENVGINPSRTGVIHILRMMGANLELSNQRELGAEPVADIRVRFAKLKGINIPADQVPLAIDEFPVLFIAAACAHGTTILTGARELRVKESDRIQVMAEGLQQLGIQARPTEDGMVIEGGTIHAGKVNSHGDHRIAMAFAVAGTVAEGDVIIEDCHNVATSFPEFISLGQNVGMLIDEQSDN